MSNTLPTLPTPEMSVQTRKNLYKAWSWLSILCVIAGAVLPAVGVPAVVFTYIGAASLGLNLLGSYLGFLANNNASANPAETVEQDVLNDASVSETTTDVPVEDTTSDSTPATFADVVPESGPAAGSKVDSTD